MRNAELRLLTVIGAILTVALPARGADVPFIEHVISIDVGGAASIFAIDLDGDGDTDVLSASELGNKIAWYENVSPCGFDSDCDVDLEDFARYQQLFSVPK